MGEWQKPGFLILILQISNTGIEFIPGLTESDWDQNWDELMPEVRWDEVNGQKNADLTSSCWWRVVCWKLAFVAWIHSLTIHFSWKIESHTYHFTDQISDQCSYINDANFIYLVTGKYLPANKYPCNHIFSFSTAGETYLFFSKTTTAENILLYFVLE